MSANAPVLSAVLQTREDVDGVVRKLSRHVPGQRGEHYLQVAVWWWSPGKTLSEMNLARSWSGIMARHAGMDPGEMWAALCGHLLGMVEVTDPFTGKTHATYVSSETIRDDKPAVKQFVDGIQRLARDHYELKLPTPDDPQAWLAFRSMKRVSTKQSQPGAQHS